MSRDGRGIPGRIVLKNQPRLRLVDVIRRRRTTLKTLANELGLTTYSRLETWCDRMGLVPPPEEEFNVTFPTGVNNPQEGVIPPSSVITEQTGLDSNEDTDYTPGTVDEPIGPSQKKRRARKDDHPSTNEDLASSLPTGITDNDASFVILPMLDCSDTGQFK